MNALKPFVYKPLDEAPFSPYFVTRATVISAGGSIPLFI
jgi:hypothetical protein